MDNRFRSAVTCVPSVRIGVDRRGLSTTIGPGGWTPPQGTGGRRLQVIGDPRLAGPLPTDRFLIPGTRTDYGTGAVSAMTSSGLESFKALLLSTAERKREIAADIRRARLQVGFAWTVRSLAWASLAAAAPPVRRAARGHLERRRTELSNLNANLTTSAVSVDFDMESAVGEPHRRMHVAFKDMMACHKKWTLSSSQRIDSVKARTTAAYVVGRQPASLGRGADPLIRTSEPPLALSVQGGRSTAYFYPGFVLVAARDGSDFALMDLAGLKVDATATRFTETEGVPGDAVVVGHTWAKSNKDGSRDRRFTNNSQIPVASYGEMTLSGQGGFREVFMTSRVGPCRDFAAAVQDLQRILSAGRGTGRVENQRALPLRR